MGVVYVFERLVLKCFGENLMVGGEHGLGSPGGRVPF